MVKMKRRSSSVIKCFVCDKKIKDKDRKISIKKGTWRHERCRPGSDNWFKKFGGYVTKELKSLKSNSEYRKYREEQAKQRKEQEKCREKEKDLSGLII